jgi:hypothetical protein
MRVALAHPASVKPGDTIWLRGGTYKGKFAGVLRGTAAAPIVVRAYPGERVTIDGYAPLRLKFAVDATKTEIFLEASEQMTLLYPGSVVRIDLEDVYIKSISGNFLSVVRGWNSSTPSAHAAGAPVPVRGPIFGIGGEYTWYWGFEVMTSDPQRVTSQSGSWPTDILRGNGIGIGARNVKLINLLIHDGADAIGFPLGTDNTEIYGCILYYTGWQGPDRGHGHGIYIQSETGPRLIRDVISFNNFATGMKAFGMLAPATNVSFDGVISFNNGSIRVASEDKEANLFAGTDRIPADQISVTNSFLYHTPGTIGEQMHFGFDLLDNRRLTVQNNFVAGGHVNIDVEQWQSAVVTDNTFYIPSLGSWNTQHMALLRMPSGYPPSALTWDRNTYFDGAPPFNNGIRYTFGLFGAKNNLGGGTLSYPEWQAATGYDRNSRYVPANPTGVQVFVRPNQYELGRAHIVIFNWDLRSSVDVDLAQVLKIGDTFEIRDVQNYFATPIVSGMYTGSLTPIPMNLTAVSRPVGNVPTIPSHTAPRFGVFVVTKSGRPNQVSVTVNPLNATLATGASQQFTAQVSGTTNTVVSWRLSSPIGSITPAGLYTAPASLTSQTTVNVIATSVADPTQSASAVVTVVPAVPAIRVSITPGSAALKAGASQQFTAQVSGTTNTAVTWRLSSPIGSITPAGLYTAPASLTSQTTVNVIATSVADPAQSASAVVTITPKSNIVLMLSPTSLSLSAGRSWQFTARVYGTANTGVKWSLQPALGSITASGLYTAPATINSQANVRVTAASNADPTVAVSALVRLY